MLSKHGDIVVIHTLLANRIFAIVSHFRKPKLFKNCPVNTLCNRSVTKG